MFSFFFFFFFNDTATTEIYTLSLHDALPILQRHGDLGCDPRLLSRHAVPAVLGLSHRRVRHLDVGVRLAVFRGVVHPVPLLLRLGPLEEGAGPAWAPDVGGPPPRVGDHRGVSRGPL